MRLRSTILCIAFIALASFASSAKAEDGLSGALSEARARSLLTNELKIAAADFDNDQRPDGAVLQRGGPFEGRGSFRIRLHFTAGQDRDLTFQSSESSLTISALDVNQDGIPDLVVEQIFTHKRLQIWLNDGHGQFRQARVQDFPFSGESPCKWTSSILQTNWPVLALPTRSEKDQAASLLIVLQFNSSSSHWRCSPPHRQESTDFLEFYSPRAPPAPQLI
ncbi:VCBS repeat-containing protein [Telmatobacter sp. DSM 110680]|uniref:VCBS repeat-containing protein n=1 Tax=Telmatobacter sp. DSM 110680 TaxID=3036704 RepID=A0AAU7DH84_9BACT